MELNSFVIRHAIELVAEMISFSRPADQAANSYFYRNKNVGKSERSEVSDLAFDVLREYVLIDSFFKSEGLVSLNEKEYEELAQDSDSDSSGDGVEASSSKKDSKSSKSSRDSKASRAKGGKGQSYSTPKERFLARLGVFIALMQRRSLSVGALESKNLVKEKDVEFLKRFKAFKSSKDLPLEARAELPMWLIDELMSPSGEAIAGATDEAKSSEGIRSRGEDEVLAIGKAMSAPAILNLRVNTLKSKRDDALKALQERYPDAKASPHSPWGVDIPSKPSLNQDPLFKNGDVEIQDEGSQLLALITGAKSGSVVVDFCAGAGGKTLAMAQMMRNKGRIYACDVSQERLSNMRPRLSRSGVTLVTPMAIDSLADPKLNRLEGKADLVLVDAPCSGTGTLKRNPDLKFRQDAESLARLEKEQRDILERASSIVAPGGHLVYATCSILERENGGQILGFLARHPEFERCDISGFLKEHSLPVDGSPMGELRIDPTNPEMDAFFACKLRRKA